MIVVAVHHLLNVVVVVISVMADVVPVADPVAAVVKGAGDWRDSLSLDLDSSHPPRRIGDKSVACPKDSTPVSPRDSHGMFIALGYATGTGSRRPAQDALRPGSGSAAENAG